MVESPGPTFNTLGKDNGKPVISVTGHETFPAKGNLDLTTVYVDGGPNGPVSVFEAFSAWLNGDQSRLPAGTASSPPASPRNSPSRRAPSR